jgi:hypothetical protein
MVNGCGREVRSDRNRRFHLTLPHTGINIFNLDLYLPKQPLWLFDRACGIDRTTSIVIPVSIGQNTNLTA